MNKMTWTVKVGKRGQHSTCITVPKKLESALGLQIGDIVECSLFGDDAIVIKKKTRSEQE